MSWVRTLVSTGPPLPPEASTDDPDPPNPQFPFLFYSTTWVLEVMKEEQRRQGKGGVDKDAGARAGSLAMLFYSIGASSPARPRSFVPSVRADMRCRPLPVAVIAGTVLPYLAERDRRLLAPDADDDDDDDDETEQEREFRRIKSMVEVWKREAKRDPKGKPVRLPTMPFMLRNIWTSALVLFSVLMCVVALIGLFTCPSHLTSLETPTQDRHLLRHQGLAGERAHLARRHLLGRRLLGPVLAAHGGESASRARSKGAEGVADQPHLCPPRPPSTSKRCRRLPRSRPSTRSPHPARTRAPCGCTCGRPRRPGG